jgi:iron complex transport system substrate-binding protein
MAKFKKVALLMAILVLSISIIGCTSNTKVDDIEDEVSEIPAATSDKIYAVEDDFGRAVSLETAPKRIISLAQSNTEIIYALGLGDTVVGVTSYDDYPEEVLEVEKIGDFNGIDLERIIELEPDLVINYGSGNEEENTRLNEAGINYVGFMPESIDEVIDTINKIGKITGAAEEAKVLTDNMVAKRDEILGKIKDAKPKKVFYEIWHEPLMAAGPGSFMDELMTMAGGENIAKDADGEYPQFDLEQLVERNPEVYLTSENMPEKTTEAIALRPGYENIDAIINSNIYILNASIVSRPGPRIIEALELIAKAIHPEKF